MVKSNLKKRGKVTILFTHHVPSFAKREVEHMKGADVVFLEMPQSEVKALSKLTLKEIASEPLSSAPEYSKIQFTGIKKMMNKGKIVKGYDNVFDDKKLTKEEKKVINKFQEAYGSTTPMTNKEWLQQMDIDAKAFQLRNKKNVEWIKKQLPEFKNKKIYILAGTMHTPLYHKLKKELESQNIPIEAIFLTKEKMEAPNIRIRFSPKEELVRALELGVPLSKERIAQLSEESKIFSAAEERFTQAFQQRGLSRENAEEAARYMLLNKYWDEMRKVIREAMRK